MINPVDIMVHVVLWRPLFPGDCDISVIGQCWSLQNMYACICISLTSFYMYFQIQMLPVFIIMSVLLESCTCSWKHFTVYTSRYKILLFHHRRVCSILPFEKNLYYFKVQLVLASIICFNRIISISTRIFHN